jgi:hypothetical protein
MAEAFGEVVTIYGDGASVQAVTQVNAEQASKRTMHRPTRFPVSGKADTAEILSRMISAAVPGYWRQHAHKGIVATRETLGWAQR